MAATDILIPTRLGDATSSIPAGPDTIVTRIDTSGRFGPTDTIVGMGEGDCILYPAFLAEEEANQIFETLLKGEEFSFQQWYHMPHPKTGHLEPLRRVKVSMATPDPETGLVPHYRFPVNDQHRYGTISPMTPTIDALRLRVNAHLGIDFNHSVVLLYRNGDDSIGYHKDKTLDLDETSPVVSISLGVPRLYTLRDRIHGPTRQEEFVLPHGALLALGRQTNEALYHSIRPAESIEAFGEMKTIARISITFRRVLTYRDPVTHGISGQGAQYQTPNWPEELQGRHFLDALPEETSNSTQ